MATCRTLNAGCFKSCFQSSVLPKGIIKYDYGYIIQLEIHLVTDSSSKVAQMSEAKFPEYTINIQTKVWKKNKETKIWVTFSK